MTAIEPQLWVDRASEAVAFYEAAFGAVVVLRVGDGEDIVARLAVGDVRFWVAAADPGLKRRSPASVDGATGRTLLVVDDPSAIHDQAVQAGATVISPVEDEHGWRLGRILDPAGHEWEIGKALS